jgi:hypothetical protein
MNNKFYLLLLVFFINFSLSSISFCTEITKKDEKTFPIQPGGQITVKADEGFIKVDSWDKPEVYLVWTKRVWAWLKYESIM